MTQTRTQAQIEAHADRMVEQGMSREEALELATNWKPYSGLSYEGRDGSGIVL